MTLMTIMNSQVLISENQPIQNVHSDEVGVSVSLNFVTTQGRLNIFYKSLFQLTRRIISCKRAVTFSERKLDEYFQLLLTLGTRQRARI